MQYIVYNRYHGKTFSAPMNLPFNTPLVSRDGILYHNNQPICFETSNVAHGHFARNDDGQGIRRGQLISAIMKRLEKHDEDHDARWEKVWEDAVCLKYKRQEFEDFFRFGHGFFLAPVEDLEHIAELVGARV